ncbi:MAG TPA: aminoacyl-tRNA hydrolase [Actinomycetales bacterium]|nr:aminoacyl-tRNA hydrolase [Actinomycetales bacterium]
MTERDARAGAGSDSAAGAWLVVGLGNPGPEYAGNRHNVGAMVLDVLAQRVGGSFRRHKARAVVVEGRLGVLPGGAPGPRVVLAKPSSYMNSSGGPVAGLRQFFGIEPAHVVAVHDELDIPFGDVRLKLGGGEGGHNGLRSLTQSLGTRDYLRVRVGVGRPPGRMDAADYVLRDFSSAERKELPLLLVQAADAVELLVLRGLLDAQQQVHAPR